jgi:hypothetical protein
MNIFWLLLSHIPYLDRARLNCQIPGELLAGGIVAILDLATAADASKRDSATGLIERQLTGLASCHNLRALLLPLPVSRMALCAIVCSPQFRMQFWLPSHGRVPTTGLAFEVCPE